MGLFQINYSLFLGREFNRFHTFNAERLYNRLVLHVTSIKNEDATSRWGEKGLGSVEVTKKAHQIGRLFICDPVGIRTPNLLIRSEVLYISDAIYIE